MNPNPRIEVVLNREHPKAEEVRKKIEAQLDHLYGLTYSKDTKPLQPGALAIDLHEVTRFLIEHGDTIADVAITALIEILHLLTAKKKDKTEKPVVILVVNDRSLCFPSSEATQRKFLSVLKQTREATPKRMLSGKNSKRD